MCCAHPVRVIHRLGRDSRGSKSQPKRSLPTGLACIDCTPSFRCRPQRNRPVRPVCRVVCRLGGVCPQIIHCVFAVIRISGNDLKAAADHCGSLRVLDLMGSSRRLASRGFRSMPSSGWTIASTFKPAMAGMPSSGPVFSHRGRRRPRDLLGMRRAVSAHGEEHRTSTVTKCRSARAADAGGAQNRSIPSRSARAKNGLPDSRMPSSSARV